MSEPLVCQAEVAKASQSPRNGQGFSIRRARKAGSLLIVNASSELRGRVVAVYVTSAAALGYPGFAHGELKSKDSPDHHVAQATCGQPGLLPCPLQRFMRENVALPLARGETKSIGVSLRKVATIGPSEFTNRSAIASQGAAAAEQGSTTALRSACNACHQAYRAAYRAKYRAQPIGRSYDLFFGVAARFGVAAGWSF